MKSLLTFIKKEYLEVIRSGKLLIILLVFILFGIMNPLMAKFTPWIMEILSDSLAESGLHITNIQVDAMMSWAQFFKNIPIALIAYVLIFADIFTKEYKSNTLLLVLSKGLSRYKVVLAKALLLLSLWTLGYVISCSITYGYNAYFWDNSIAHNLFYSLAFWWLFGIWVICLIVFFSSLLQNNSAVLICIGLCIGFAYILSIIPNLGAYSPMMLINSNNLLIGISPIDSYIKAIIITAILSIISITISIPIINKKQL